jgi:hypothetical protein
MQVAVAEILAEVAHVQDADAGLVHLGHLHAVFVECGEVELMGRAREASPAMLPCAAEDWQTSQRAEQHGAVAMVLDADQRSQQRRLSRRVLAREALDVFCRQSDSRGHLSG